MGCCQSSPNDRGKQPKKRVKKSANGAQEKKSTKTRGEGKKVRVKGHKRHDDDVAESEASPVAANPNALAPAVVSMTSAATVPGVPGADDHPNVPMPSPKDTRVVITGIRAMPRPPASVEVSTSTAAAISGIDAFTGVAALASGGLGPMADESVSSSVSDATEGTASNPFTAAASGGPSVLTGSTSSAATTPAARHASAASSNVVTASSSKHSEGSRLKSKHGVRKPQSAAPSSTPTPKKLDYEVLSPQKITSIKSWIDSADQGDSTLGPLLDPQLAVEQEERERDAQKPEVQRLLSISTFRAVILAADEFTAGASQGDEEADHSARSSQEERGSKAINLDTASFSDLPVTA